jgi:hypothetical protein
MKMNRLFWRSVYYLRAGAAVLGFPITFLTFITVAYDNLSFVQSFFGSFLNFVLVSFPCFILFIGFFGWYWLKRSKFFKQELEIGVEVNLYQTEKLTPVGVPSAKALFRFFKKEGVDCHELEALLERSEL